MFFKDIIGNEKNQNALKTVIKNGKISHAYIMSGIDGVGKQQLPKLFLWALCVKILLMTAAVNANPAIL
ncbi:MAG: hypothetical protein IJC74_07500 [Clostridia bacterium]|nr:hypothetical protein [Clostridia bacterium]